MIEIIYLLYLIDSAQKAPDARNQMITPQKVMKYDSAQNASNARREISAE